MTDGIREKEDFRRDGPIFPALIPIPVFIVSAILLYATDFESTLVFEPPFLLPTLNLMFLFVCPMVVGYMTIAGYLENGSIGLMMLGGGVLSLAVGSLLAGFLLSSGGPNAVITVHNIAAFSAAIFHLTGAGAALKNTAPEPDASRRKHRIMLLLSAICLLLLILAIGASRGLLPLFFIQGKGPTLLRQAILGGATLGFFIAAGLFLILFRNSRSRFLLWYGSGLGLIAVGLGCVFLQKAFGSPIGWLGRSAQYLGGIYFIVAVFSGSREIGTKVTGVDNMLETIFRNRLEMLLADRTRQLSSANERLRAEIAEREQLQEALKDSEERLRLVLEGGRIGFWDWNIPTGNVKRDRQWAEMLGYTLEEIESTVTQWSDLHHPDDREAAWKSIRDHLEGRSPWHEMEYRMRTKTGDYKWILDRAMIVKRDSQGEPVRMCGTHADISKLKWTEEALRASEAKYRSMMEAMKDPAYICADDYRITYMNPSMIRRIGRDAAGEYCYKAIYGRDEKCPWCVYHRILAGEHVAYEQTNTPNGRQYAVSNSPMPLQDGSVSKLTIFRDITEIKAMESRMSHARKMASIGTLAGGIAHHFNNILGIIIGNTELGLEEIPEGARGNARFKEIRRAGLRAAALVKQLLEFSRKTDPQLTLQRHFFVDTSAAVCYGWSNRAHRTSKGATECLQKYHMPHRVGTQFHGQTKPPQAARFLGRIWAGNHSNRRLVIA